MDRIISGIKWKQK